MADEGVACPENIANLAAEVGMSCEEYLLKLENLLSNAYYDKLALIFLLEIVFCIGMVSWAAKKNKDLRDSLADQEAFYYDYIKQFHEKQEERKAYIRGFTNEQPDWMILV